MIVMMMMTKPEEKKMIKQNESDRNTSKLAVLICRVNNASVNLRNVIKLC